MAVVVREGCGLSLGGQVNGLLGWKQGDFEIWRC